MAHRKFTGTLFAQDRPALNATDNCYLMACRHKFEDYLDLERLDFDPTTLIVGTFNPAWPATNAAEWFYGRTHDEYGNQNNNFWDVLPRLYGEKSLINQTDKEWKQFCHDERIAITDIVQAIDDADEQTPEHIKIIGGYADDTIAANFYDFELTNLVRLIRRHPSITNIYVTRSYTSTFWKQKLYPLIWFCKASGKTLKPLLTPSGFAFREQAKYNRQKHNAPLTLPDFIKMRWEAVWHNII
ncbi:MAG TPA: hypothetical protein VGB56_12250 [Flavisolibacter sp.]